jgi:hypothetical protein
MMSGLSYRPNLKGKTVSLLRGARCRRESWAYNSTSRSGGGSLRRRNVERSAPTQSRQNQARVPQPAW